MKTQSVLKILLREWKLFLKSSARDLGVSGGVSIFFESPTARLRLGLIAIAIREYRENPSAAGEGVRLGGLHEDILKIMTQSDAAYDEMNIYGNIRSLFDSSRFKIDGSGYKIKGESYAIHNPERLALAFSDFARTQHSGIKEHLVLKLKFESLGVSHSEAETPHLAIFLSREFPVVPCGQLTTEVPIATPEHWRLWFEKVQENRILAGLEETECAVAYELSSQPIILEYNPESRYKQIMPSEAESALELY